MSHDPSYYNKASLGNYKGCYLLTSGITVDGGPFHNYCGNGVKVVSQHIIIRPHLKSNYVVVSEQVISKLQVVLFAIREGLGLS